MKPLSLRWRQVEALQCDGHTHIGICRRETPAVHDVFWVREQWKYWDWTEDGEPFIRYRDRCGIAVSLVTSYDVEHADAVQRAWEVLSDRDNFDIDGAARDRKWRNAVTMPRWASRYIVRVTQVAVPLDDDSQAVTVRLELV